MPKSKQKTRGLIYTEGTVARIEREGGHYLAFIVPHKFPNLLITHTFTNPKAFATYDKVSIEYEPLLDIERQKVGITKIK